MIAGDEQSRVVVPQADVAGDIDQRQLGSAFPSGRPSPGVSRRGRRRPGPPCPTVAGMFLSRATSATSRASVSVPPSGPAPGCAEAANPYAIRLELQVRKEEVIE